MLIISDDTFCERWQIICVIQPDQHLFVVEVWRCTFSSTQICVYFISLIFFWNTWRTMWCYFCTSSVHFGGNWKVPSKFHQFNNRKFHVTIKWISKKVKSFFSLKDKNCYPAWQIYKGTCVCDEIYIDETFWNFGMLTLDGMSMRAYVRNLKLQSI